MAQAGRKPGRPPKNDNIRRSAEGTRKKTLENAVGVNKSVIREIWAIIFIASGIFLFAAMQFHLGGKIGDALGDGLKGVLGPVGFTVPWYLILCGALFFIDRKGFTLKISLLAPIILATVSLLYSAHFIDGVNAYDAVGFYRSGVRLEGGGVLGMYLGIFLVKFIGKVGLYVFSAAVLLVSLLLMVNRPVSKALEALGKKLGKRRGEKEQTAETSGQDGNQLFFGFNRDDHVKIVTPYKEEEGVNSVLENSKKRANKSRLLEYMSDDSPLGSGESKKMTKVKGDDGSKPLSIKTYGLEQKNAPGKGFGLVGVPERPLPETRFASAGERPLSPQSGKLTDTDGEVTLSDDEILRSRKRIPQYRKPPISLLNKPKVVNQGSINSNLKLKAAILEETLKNFRVDARVVQVTQGPAVTRYEIQPAVGVKVSSIVRLSDDIALNLRAKSIRIEAPIPGKAAVGIETENDHVNMVTLREIIDSEEFKSSPSKITFAVGKDIGGKAIVADLKNMPHLLIAGSTGSGKSVCINSIIMSILYKADPDEVKLVLIDPKVVELGSYNGIPHLLIPVVTEPVKAAAALNWAVAEMTDRYKKFADNQVRDLESYNEAMRMNGDDDSVMPQIVIIIDELADLMMAAPSQVEESICRLAQMARAAGMHLIVATQRPSVDIITGVIKANIPSRIAFAVSSQFDSRTILDMSGAEKLVGKGDMLFNPLGMGKPLRVQGTFVSDTEVHNIIKFVKSQVLETEYSDEAIETIERGNSLEDRDKDGDELLPEAIACVVHAGQASVSMLQRRFRIGYNRAARIVDMMEARGIVGPQDKSRPRQVLLTEEEFEEMRKDTEI